MKKLNFMQLLKLIQKNKIPKEIYVDEEVYFWHDTGQIYLSKKYESRLTTEYTLYELLEKEILI